MSQETEPANIYLEVQELTIAVETVQAMEARGDFKYKGIFAVFNSIQEWSAKFSTNGILPAIEQISRETDQPVERIRIYINEMLGRGNKDTRYIVAIPAVDFVASPEPSLTKIVVYCRPGKSDGTNASRYVASYIDKSCKAITNWVTAKDAPDPAEYARYLKGAIEQGRLKETQAGAEIARFFYSDLDNTLEKKKMTYTYYARPVIRKLIENGQLIYLKDKDPNSRNDLIFYNRPDHLSARIETLTSYFLSDIERGANREHFRESLDMYRGRLSTLPPNHAQVINELLLLIPALDQIEKDEEETKRKKKLDDVIQEIARNNRVIDLGRIKNITDQLISMVCSSSSVLNVEYPVQDRVVRFALYRENAPFAVKFARDLFEKTGNDLDARILSLMGIEKYLDADSLRIFENLEREVFFAQLPLFVRLWRSLFGDGRLKADEVLKVKSSLNSNLEKQVLDMQTSEARRAQKQLADERVRQKKSASGATADTSGKTGGDDDLIEAIDNAEQTQDEIQAIETLKKMIQVLDKAWDENLLPNRTLLLEEFPQFSEEDLIPFLKKYGRKEVFSFRVKNEKPEYVWPVLITRRYIRQHGKRLLNDAMERADKQRKAAMPNQEVFDINTAIEDFLTRVLSKLK